MFTYRVSYTGFQTDVMIVWDELISLDELETELQAAIKKLREDGADAHS